MRPKSSSVIIVLLLVIVALLAYNTFSHKGNTSKSETAQVNSSVSAQTETQTKPQVAEASQQQSIEELTNEKVVVPYVKEHGKLPDCYITKREAKSQGWNPSQGNLCDVLPGRAIGGDVFTNRERSLPTQSGRVWYEADLNFNCGNRNSDRLLFSNDGLVYVTHNHYKTFEQQ